MIENKPVVLFDNKDKCCACGACMNICPKQAISMKEDEYGFLYPHIDDTICIKCGACKRVCSYQNNKVKNVPKATYAGANKNRDQILSSASGGVFVAIATKVLKENGVVVGAALEKENGKFVNHHIAVKSIQDLYKLQGSKYIQSYNGLLYKSVKTMLEQGTKVLYSGTPCQVAGLYGFLGKDYENLLTIDLVCHGTPNNKMFNDYIKVKQSQLKAEEITNYIFRDKKHGWGESGRVDYIDKDGSEKSRYSLARTDSYNSLFLDVLISRENCYSCKYAGANRPGDITLGDYWGIENVHPEIVKSNNVDIEAGISCIIANTDKGKQVCDSLNNSELIMFESTFDNAAKYNRQLNRPAKISDKRKVVLDIYKNSGYEELELFYRKKYFKQRIIHIIYNKIPRTLRAKIKKVLK